MSICCVWKWDCKWGIVVIKRLITTQEIGFNRSLLNCVIRIFIWLIFYRFAQGLRLRQVDMLQEGITQSSATLSKLADKLRRVCKSGMKRMRRRGKQTVGQRTEIVMIDESKFGHKRKVWNLYYEYYFNAKYMIFVSKNMFLMFLSLS